MKDIKAQGELNAKISQDISNLRQEVHGASASVASQVKKLKTESQYKWNYEGNKVQFLLNSDELTQSIWAIDNSKVEYARETITEVIEKIQKRNAINILILPMSVIGVGELFDNTRVIQSLATRMRRLKSTKQKIGRYVNAIQWVKRLP